MGHPIAIVLPALRLLSRAQRASPPSWRMSRRPGASVPPICTSGWRTKRQDELGHLARSFNSLLDRLSQSFERQQRFMADASHELRTPVAICAAKRRFALSQQSRSPEEYRESLGDFTRSGGSRTSRGSLHAYARGAGQYPLQPRDFYLDELVAECVHRLGRWRCKKRFR